MKWKSVKAVLPVVICIVVMVLSKRVALVAWFAVVVASAGTVDESVADVVATLVDSWANNKSGVVASWNIKIK